MASFAAVLLLSALLPLAAVACEVCWGAGVDTPTTRGISMAMLALIGMTGLVGSAIGAFFYNMNRRSEMLQPGDLEVTEFGGIRDRDDTDAPPDF